MATAASYAVIPQFTNCTVTTANTSRANTSAAIPTSGVILLTGYNTAVSNADKATYIRRIVIQAQGTTTAGAIRFWLNYRGSVGGATYGGTAADYIMICEKLVPAITPSTSISPFRTEVPELVGLIIPTYLTTPYNLYVTTNNTETFNVYCESSLF